MSVIWLVLIALAVWALIRWVTHQTQAGPRQIGAPPNTLSAEEILRQRFARGEIDAATFQNMREQLEASTRRPGTSGDRAPGHAD
ncbi:MAG TPA: SHOCT domain-containing protein [Ktedonobacterales bacterium]